MWHEKVVLITGASSGIGRGLALELARRGAKLGLLARRADLLDEVVWNVEGRGAKALALPVSVQDGEAVKAAVGRLRMELGPIDVMIANAGIGSTSDAAELDVNDVARVFGVNVIGAAS